MAQNSIKKFITVFLAAAAGWLFLRYFLPLFMPFFLALLVAAAAEPAAGFFQKKLHFPRWAAAGAAVSLTFLLLALVGAALGMLLLRQLQALARALPDLENSAAEGIRTLRLWLVKLCGKAPGRLGTVLQRSVEGLFSDSRQYSDAFRRQLLDFCSGTLKKVPDSLLSIGTFFLACFLFSARLPRIRQAVRSRIPPSWKYLPALQNLKASSLQWLRAQGKLMGITFLVLTLCFLILRIPYALPAALGIALIDALPVLGTAVILIPWSILSFLQGKMLRSAGLLITYAAAGSVRSLLEPRLVGKQLGLDPLITLAAMYAGFRLLGIPGMIFAPLITAAVFRFVSGLSR